MLRKSGITLVLAAILVLVMASASFASPGNGNGHGKNGKGKWKIKVQDNWKATQLTDVGSHWAEQPVRFMLTQGIVTGYPDFTFRPNNPVTKYEAIMMIARASGFDGTADQSLTWDKSVPDWVRECLDYAVEEEILTEAEADNFKGWEPAKRYEVAIWAVRAIGLEEDDQTSFLDDNEIPFFARSYIGVMCKNRFMVGYPGNVFQPNKPVTRAELAAIIYRIMLSETEGDGNNTSNLEIYSLTPADGSDSVDPATDNITARFNVDIKAIDDLQSVKEGIQVRNVTDGDNVGIDEVNIDGKYLTINLEDSLENDKTYRVTIDGNIIESEESGENFEGISGSAWEFSTGTNSTSNLEIYSLTPADGSDSVDPATDNLTARFNVDIKAIDDLQSVKEGIQVRNVTDGDNVGIDEVNIDGKYLTINLEDSLENDKTYRVTIDGNIIESEESGENFEGISGSAWEFSTEKVNNFRIVSLSPADGDDDVDGANTEVLRAEFSDDIQVVSGKDLDNAARVYNESEDEYVDIDSIEIDNDTLIITLEEPLAEGNIFEVTIKADYLEEVDSGVNSDGITGTDWRFETN